MIATPPINTKSLNIITAHINLFNKNFDLFLLNQNMLQDKRCISYKKISHRDGVA